MQDRFKFRAWDNKERYYIPNEETNFCHGMMEYWFDKEECPLTFEQCTGLKDKNGKLIYEGDIITGFFNNNKVIWDKGRFCVDDGSEVFDELAKLNEECVIIGNIHENPELLEENND